MTAYHLPSLPENEWPGTRKYAWFASVKSQAFNQRTPQYTGRQSSCLVKYNHKFHPFLRVPLGLSTPASLTPDHIRATDTTWLPAFGLVGFGPGLRSDHPRPKNIRRRRRRELLFWIVLRFMHISNIYSPLYDNGRASESESNPTDSLVSAVQPEFMQKHSPDATGLTALTWLCGIWVRVVARRGNNYWYIW